MIARELYTHEGTSWNLACNQVRTGCSSFKSLLTPTNVFSTSNISRSWEEESSSLMSIFKAGSGVDSKLPTRAKIIMDSNFPPAFTMGSIYGDCWHFFRLHQGQKWAWKYIKIVQNCSRNYPDQKLELMMTKLDQNKMKVFDERFSKDGLDCRQVIWIQHLQPVSEVRTG